MLTVFLRTVITYLILMIAMRIMGKRQIGELEVSELIVTFMLSELATGPISNLDIPISHAVIPIITVLTFEVITSVILIKIPRIKNLVSPKPSVLIAKGELDQREMARIRMSIDELVGELRRQGSTSIEEIEYAILEQNGKMTIIPKMKYRQPTLEQMKLKDRETGIAHILIADGYVNRYNLEKTGHGDAWLENELKHRGCRSTQVYLMTVDDGGNIFFIPKEGKT